MRLTQAKKEARLNISKKEQRNKSDYTLEVLTEYISQRMLDITTSNLFAQDLTEEQFKRKKRRRKELKIALKKCNTGDSSSRAYVISYIFDLLVKEKNLDERTVDYAIPFHLPGKMTSEQKFITLLHKLEKKNGFKALGEFITKFELDKPKPDGGYRVLEQEVDEIYKKVMGKGQISTKDKIEIITIMIYSSYKGFGVIDYIREMSIDGVSGGVSGMPEFSQDIFSDEDEEFVDHVKKVGMSSSLESVWVMYKGKKIHFSFLSFKTSSELRRVVTNVYKYGYPGQLSETKPAIINEMADGSRVTVMRPKLAESWAFFIRKKYDAKKVELTEVIKHENNEAPIKLLQLLMKSKRNVAVTGLQGSGKTTLLMALVEYINPALSLRIQETKFELNLRRLYSNRNILSFQETDSFSGQESLDLQKKTDGDVTILGEVATNPVAVWMIQTSQVASLFTLFTHHAKTFAELVFSLRNSLLNEGMFSNEKIAEQQVVSVLQFDVHMRQSEETGERFIERITECIPATFANMDEAQKELINLTDTESKMDFLIKMQSVYYLQQTQTQQFIENTILEFKDGKYITVNPISDKRLKEMMYELNKEDQNELRYLMEEVWGGKNH
ncbi:MAG: Flp pilus assembly complex ATPase component TadA [Kurthia sp.]|nr:Flp pilus assembly complex ATPase component TadA [Candidatus Kurthia equi]